MEIDCMTQAKKTEKQKYLEWYEDQVKNHGLQYVKPIVAIDFETGRPILPAGTTEEDIYRSLNEINDAVAKGKAYPIVGI